MTETKMEPKTETKIKKKRIYKRKNKAQETAPVVESPAPVEDHREDLDTSAIVMGDVVPSVGPSLTEFGEPDIVITETKGNALNMGNLKPRKWPFASTSPKQDSKKKTPSVLTMSSLPSRRK